MRKPVIHVEGMERCGKSSFVSYLSERLYKDLGMKSVVVHNGKPPKGAGDEYQDLHFSAINYLDISLVDFDVLIFDRSFVGENVYGPLYRGRKTVCNPLTNREQWNHRFFFFTDTPEAIAARNDSESFVDTADGFAVELEQWERAWQSIGVYPRLFVGSSFSSVETMIEDAYHYAVNDIISIKERGANVNR